MRVVITGAAGFLGWHARCALRARGDAEVATVDRAEWADPSALDVAVKGADVVLHLAGTNRAEPDALREQNAALAHALTAALDRTEARPSLVYANSIHAGNGTAFGDGKQDAAEHLLAWGASAAVPVADVRLPNLFGEHGRPFYNSVVATFCHQLVYGESPVLEQDRELPLLHVQDAVDRMLASAGRTGTVELDATPTTVSDLLRVLTGMQATYATGEIPDLTAPLRLALFNTYRSFAFPERYPIRMPAHTDERGILVEGLRAHGGPAQVFCSSTAPGRTRGEHFHVRKVERFLVVRGQAAIALRRLFHDEVVRFAVSGDEPAAIDMPTLWTHKITNTGTDELTTLFWTSELYDPARPDTYREAVE